MKKILSVLCMILGIGLLATSCSSDDKEGVQSPITGLSIPASAEIGSSVTIQGSGFTADAKFYLEGTDSKRTEATAETSDAGAVMTIPMTVTAGNYKVILLQNGEWTLGNIALTAPGLPITSLSLPEIANPGKEFVIGGIGFQSGDAITLQAENANPISITNTTASASELTLTIPDTTPENTYTVSLVRGANSWNLGTIKVQKAMRVASLQVQSEAGDISLKFTYDSNGRLTTLSDGEGMDYQLTYNKENTVTFDSPITGQSITLTLDNGKVVSSPIFDMYGDPAGTYTWNYTSDYLTSMTGGDPELAFNYDSNGNLTSFTGMQDLTYEYGNDARDAVSGTIDPAIALNIIALLYGNDATLIGFLLNNTIKTSAKVPTKLSLTVQGETGADVQISSDISSSYENNTLTMNIVDKQVQTSLGSKVIITYEEAE